MDTIQHVALGSGRTFVGPGAIGELGGSVRLAGGRALILAGDRAWQAALDAGATRMLDAAGVEYERRRFSGYCSPENVSAAMQSATAFGARVLMGIGGGKCLDTTKSVADRLGLPCVLVPTSCATCAADVRLCVWYDELGRCVPGMFARDIAHTLIVDTDIIVGHGEARLMASGMMDALAKYPELDYSLRMTPQADRSIALITAQRLAWSNFNYILENGPLAYAQALERKNSFLTEQMVCVSILETGLSSNLVAGVKQLAVAHMFHDAVCTCFHDQRTKFLHGEIVAVGVILQMHSNGYDAELIDRTEAFIRAVHGPLCLSDLEIEPGDDNKRIILDYIASRGYSEPDVYKRIEEAYAFINR